MRASLVAIVVGTIMALAVPGAAKRPHGDADVTTQQNGVPGVTAVAEYGSLQSSTASPPSGGVPAEQATAVASSSGDSGVAVSAAELSSAAAQDFTPAPDLAGQLYPVTFTPCINPELTGCIPAFLDPPSNPNPPGGGHNSQAPPPSPEELAQVAIDRAAASAALPELRLAPSVVGLTGLDSYVWLAERPRAIEAGASVPGLTVIAQARPVQYVWDFGDGTTLVTDHPGRPWSPRRPGNIAHLYEVRGGYSVGVEIIWSARWQIAGGPWTDLGFFSTSGSRAYPVRQIVTRLVPAR